MMVLFVIAILLIAAILYSVFCWTPGKESRKEEKEDGKQEIRQRR
jgi:hypothetical protein